MRLSAIDPSAVGFAVLWSRKDLLLVGEVVSLHSYASRKIREERVALNEAALRHAWEQ